MEIRAARPDEARVLSELALRSKGHWGYSAEFLDSVRGELTLSPDFVAATESYPPTIPHNYQAVSVAEVDGRVVGFYTLEGAPPEGELGHLWVDPAAIGTGVGRRLWNHAVETARANGFTALLIEADPNAEGFYLAMGAERVGETPSGSVTGRILPLLRFAAVS